MCGIKWCHRSATLRQQQRSKASDSPADSERLSATAELSVHMLSGAVRAAAARDACDARRLDPFSQLRQIVSRDARGTVAQGCGMYSSHERPARVDWSDIVWLRVHQPVEMLRPAIQRVLLLGQIFITIVYSTGDSLCSMVEHAPDDGLARTEFRHPGRARPTQIVDTPLWHWIEFAFRPRRRDTVVDPALGFRESGNRHAAVGGQHEWARPRHAVRHAHCLARQSFDDSDRHLGQRHDMPAPALGGLARERPCLRVEVNVVPAHPSDLGSTLTEDQSELEQRTERVAEPFELGPQLT